MKFKEFLQIEESSGTRAEKEAKRAAKKKAELDAKYDGKPMKIRLPVIVANGKKIHREFTIDNTLQSRRALAGETLQDLHQVEANPDKRGKGPSYAIFNPRQTKGSSIPARLHGLPARTHRKTSHEAEDLRREAYE